MTRNEFLALRDRTPKLIEGDVILKPGKYRDFWEVRGIKIAKTRTRETLGLLNFRVFQKSKKKTIHIAASGYPVCRVDIGVDHAPYGRNHKHSFSEESDHDMHTNIESIDWADENTNYQELFHQFCRRASIQFTGNLRIEK